MLNLYCNVTSTICIYTFMLSLWLISLIGLIHSFNVVVVLLSDNIIHFSDIELDMV